jgi:hypothetical protein
MKSIVLLRPVFLESAIQSPLDAAFERYNRLSDEVAHCVSISIAVKILDDCRQRVKGQAAIADQYYGVTKYLREASKYYKVYHSIEISGSFRSQLNGQSKEEHLCAHWICFRV